MASTEKNLDPVTQNARDLDQDLNLNIATNQPRYQKIDTEAVTNQTKDDSVQNYPRTSAPPVEPSNDVTTRTGGGKRKAVSYDTGTRGDKGTRYQAIKAKILSGELNPSTSQLRKHWQCNYETAAAYLLAMAEEGLLVRNPANSQYTLKEGV